MAPESAPEAEAAPEATPEATTEASQDAAATAPEAVEQDASEAGAAGAAAEVSAEELVPEPQEPDVPIEEDIRLPSVGRVRSKELLGEKASQTRDSDDFAFEPADTVDDRSLRIKAMDNLDAIEIIKSGIEFKDLTQEHREILARYSGWTGMSRAFMLPGGRYAPGWEDVAKALADKLDKTELEQLAKSASSSNYLPASVMSLMWQAAEKMGFEGGVFLDPAAGAARSFGLEPHHLALRTQRIGLTADPFSHRVAQLLYPSSILSEETFEQFSLPGQSVDLAMGSIPFGSKRLHDPSSAAVNLAAANVHGFYFVKTMTTLRPGGVQMFVVPRMFMDSEKTEAVNQRKWLSKHAELIDAVRLPADAFEDNGAPKTPLDLIVLKKREHPLGYDELMRPTGFDLDDQDFFPDPWCNVLNEGAESPDGRPIAINAWYAMHPDKILGKLDILAGRYGDDEPTVTSIEGSDVVEMLQEHLKRLPSDIMPAPQGLIEVPDQEEEIAAHGVALGDYFETADDAGNPKLAKVVDFVAGKPIIEVDHTLEGKNFEKVLGMVRLADTVQDLLYAQSTEGFSDATVESVREKLNGQYDEFKKQFGYLNNRMTSRLFSSDSRWAQVMALEEDYRPAISKAKAEAEGIKPSAEFAEKSPILLERTQWPVAQITHAETAFDAMRISMAQVGRIDWELMSRLLGEDFSLDRMRDDLADHIMVDPYSGRWELKEAVLCGDVMDKIDQIQHLLVTDSVELQSLQDSLSNVVQPKWGTFDLENARARLQEIIPARVNFNDIGITPGAPWIPPQVVLEFVESLTGVKLDAANVTYSTAVNKWSFKPEIAKLANAGVVSSYSSKRMPIDRMLGAIFNNKPIMVRDPATNDNGNVVYVINPEDTAMARANAQSIQQAWNDWIGADPQRRDLLENIYNERMNRMVERRFDGSHLTFPGMSPRYSLRPHQKDFVARALMGGNILADHAVGAGKTFMTIATIMEGRRMGLFKKPFVVVPDAIVGQWATATVNLYPQARVIAGASSDFANPAERNKFFARCAYGDYDMIIVSQNVFAMLKADPSMEAEFLRRELEEIKEIKHELNNSEEVNRRTKASSLKGYAAREKAIHQRVKSLLSEPDKDAAINMGQIGVDYLVVDEAHLHKNKGVNTTLNVAGLGNRNGSKRARDMFLKVRSVQAKYPNGEGGVAYLTGTPISNTIAEMHGLMEVMIPGRLKRMGLMSFDAWARTFARIETAFAFTLTGEFKEITSLAKFHNLPELQQLYRSFADVITTEKADRLLREAGLDPLPVPKIKGGKPTVVLCGMTPAQKAIIGFETGQDEETGSPIYNEGSVMWMLDHLHASSGGKGDPNTLTLIGDLRKAGLDARAYLTAPGPSIRQEGATTIVPIADRLRAAIPMTQEDLHGNLAADAQQVANADAVDSLLDMGEDFTGIAAPVVEDVEFTMVQGNAPEGAAHVPLDADSQDQVQSELLQQAQAMMDSTEVERPPKILSAVHHMMEEYRASMDDKGVQIVFLDFSTPSKRASKPSAKAKEVEALCRLIEAVEDCANPEPAEVQKADDATEKLSLYTAEEIHDLRMEAQGQGAQRWSAYQEMRKLLIEQGVPPGEIAFIHEYDTTKQRNLLFDELRAGTKRFLFGSTPKIGAGVDVQNRIVALHHIDSPWRPSDMDQRNGRGLRQGNELLAQYGDDFRVGIYYYVTEGAFDAGLFQILERKQKFMEQIKSNGDVREMVDPERQAFDAGAIKAIASGNELLRDRTQAEAVLLRLNETLKGARREAGHVEYMADTARRNMTFHEERAPAMARAAILASSVIEDIQTRKQDLESQMVMLKDEYDQAMEAYREERDARALARTQAKKDARALLKAQAQAKKEGQDEASLESLLQAVADPFEGQPEPVKPSKDAIEKLASKGPYDFSVDGKPENLVRELSAGAVADLLVRRLIKVDSWAVSMADFREVTIGHLNGCEITLRDKDNFTRKYMFRVYPPGARRARPDEQDVGLDKAYQQFSFYEGSLFGQQGRSMMFRTVIDSMISMRNGAEINAKDIEERRESLEAMQVALKQVNEVTIPAIRSQIEPMEKIVDLSTLGLRMGVKKWDRLEDKLREAVQAASALRVAEIGSLDKNQQRIADRGVQAARFLPQLEEIAQHAKDWLDSADDVSARIKRQMAEEAQRKADEAKAEQVKPDEALPSIDDNLMLDFSAQQDDAGAEPGTNPVDHHDVDQASGVPVLDPFEDDAAHIAQEQIDVQF